MTDTDMAARIAALDPCRSFCVTAPAGSGKTELLTQRLLALLTRVERPEQVLAITFTRKAAAEMRDRLLEKLEEAEQGKEVVAEHEWRTRELAMAVLAHARAKQWSLDPELFNLRTIDSLCGDLTRQMPIVSALGGAIEVTEQYQPLFEEAVVALLERVETPDQTGVALRALLLNFDNDWERLRGLLVQLLGRRGDWGRRLGMHHSPDEAEQSLRQTVAHLTASVLVQLSESVAADLPEFEALANIAANNLHLPEVSLGVSAIDLEAWRQASDILFKKDGDWRSPKGINKTVGFPPEESDAKQRLILLLEALQKRGLHDLFTQLRRLPSIDGSDESWQLVLHLSQLLPVLQAELLLVFQKHSRVDYTHIALAAEDALGPDDNPTDLALRLDYQLEHILIDEFQDTSDQQFRLLHQLTRGWAEHNAGSETPRTLFLVGDGMQSIYGFRYANVSLFLQARDRGVGGITLEPLTLTHNFRSQGGVVSWVNTAFSKLFPVQDDIAQGRVSHSVATATRSALAGEAISTHIFATNSGTDEARFIAATIVDLRRTEPEASIAVLIRAKHHALPLITALRDHGVGFIGRDLEPLAATASVTDLMSLCRWLANPADDLAALALLRAPFCGLQLAEIYSFWSGRGGLRRDLSAAVSSLSEDAGTRLAHLVAALDWAIEYRDRLALADWIEQIWLRLGGDLCSPLGSERDAQRFFTLLREADAVGVGLDIDWLERRLALLFAEHPEEPAAIEIMTLHKSKGLQFDYVFMPRLDKGTAGTDKALLRWHLHVDPSRAQVDVGGLLIAADDRQGPTVPSLYNYLSWLQVQRDAAELRRLIYVGVTRAKQRAWLTAEAKADKDWPRWPAKQSPMGILQSIVEADAQFHDLSTTEAHQADASAHNTPGADPPDNVYPVLSRLPLSALTPYSSRDVELARNTAPDNVFRPGNAPERLLGTAVHRALELLADCGEDSDSSEALARNAIHSVLRQGGLNGRLLEETAQGAFELVARTRRGATGRWVLAPRNVSKNEWILWEMDQEPRQRIIDRYFFDEATSTHYVIDYKTSRPNPYESIDEFSARETAHYAEQLASYHRILSLKGLSPIKTCLYFCALDHLLIIDP